MTSTETRGETTRTQIIEAADRLFYEQGFEPTSFTDIAGAVGLSRGNFYYHFKTKDEILDAVIDLRLERTRAMLGAWAATDSDPRGRIRSFIGILIAHQDAIMQHGCPVGTLCTELAKLGHASRERAADIFRVFRTWLTDQLLTAGFARDDADAMSLHLLAASQGVAVLAQATGDTAFVVREVERLQVWLDAQFRRRRSA